jgi:hypothetical protein
MQALIAMSPSGHVAYTAGFDTAGALITVADTTGKVVARFGRPGPGPGEHRNIAKLEMTDTTVVVVTMAPSRLTTYSLDGRILSERPGPGRTIVVGMVGDSIDVMDMDARNFSAIRVAGFRRQAMDGTGGRTIIDSTNKAFRTFRETAAGSPRTDVFLYAAEPRRIAVVNFRKRAMRLYDTKGSVLAEVDSLAIVGQPFFDAGSRLWLVGIKDSTWHVAVHTSGMQTTAYPLECREASGFALSGMWFALLCRDEKTSGDAGFELQLYRIVPTASAAVE